METSAVPSAGTLRAGIDGAAGLALFDSLPAVEPDEMLGDWRGFEVPTGHPLDGMLERLGWHGKRFGGPEDVDPLVFETGAGRLVRINPALVPLGLALRHADLFTGAAGPRLFSVLRPLIRTRAPRARLRAVEHRGVVTATMVYDALPICDHFRRLDERALLGLMDLRGAPPYLFGLTR